MSQDERVSFAGDNRRPDTALPRRFRERTKVDYKPRPPALWTSPETETFDDLYEGDWGLYPKGFIPWAARVLRAAPDRVLHVCSGRIPKGMGRARVDIRREVSPDVQADGRALPFCDGAFDAVMIDPPYSVEYAEGLYGIDYPRPSHLLEEASRVTRPCGRIGILHFLVPMPPSGVRLELVRGVTTGCGYRIRAFTVFEKNQPGLPGMSA